LARANSIRARLCRCRAAGADRRRFGISKRQRVAAMEERRPLNFVDGQIGLVPKVSGREQAGTCGPLSRARIISISKPTIGAIEKDWRLHQDGDRNVGAQATAAS
jgi:hypothetical protein